MALTATIHNLSISLSDVDRSVYENLELRMARQPSETVEYMLMRAFAYCLEYSEGISFTEGVAAGDAPAVIIRDLTGKTTAWIEVGMPDPDRIYRGLKLAGRAAVYTHRDPQKLVKGFAGAGIARLAEIPVFAFDRGLIEEVAALLTRRNDLTLSITERVLYLDVDGQSFSSSISEYRMGMSVG